MPAAVSKSVAIISKSLVTPSTPSTIPNLKLTVSDLPMLSCHYIQKGCLFTHPPIPTDALIPHLKRSLSQTLAHFPPLAGRLITDANGHVYIASNDAGAGFVNATATQISIRDVVVLNSDVPDCFKEFFAMDRTVSYDGHFKPILTVQVTDLADGVFIGVAVNHAVVDGTSLWNFFNSFSEVCRGEKRISNLPDFNRMSPIISPAVLRVPAGGPKVTFSGDAPLRERIFSFTGEVLENGIGWCAEQLSESVKAHGDGMVRKYVKEWEDNPRCFPLGNFDGGMITMGSSPRFPMYDNDLGWGKPVAVRSGRANKFDGKISAFPGREGGGSIDLEVVLAPETMAGLELDSEFMQYVKVSPQRRM